jgi:hypothetical protein
LKSKLLSTAIILTLSSSCQRGTNPPVGVIQMSDAKAGKQLIAGFYDVEANSWRWTARRFAVTFPQPANAKRNGAKLQLQLFIPGSQIEKLGPMTLTADVDEHPLTPETFSAGGQYTFTRDVPADALRSNLVPVIFTFDKAVAPGPADGRELGAVISMAALISK